jgi:phosphate transport system protein
MTIQAVQAQSTEDKINSLLETMGRKVDEAVSRAITALLDSNSHIVAGVMENAVATQELELAIDQIVFSALEQGDLRPCEVRRFTSAVNISKDLVRLGKLAANLGRKVTQVGKHNDHEDFSKLQPLAIAVSHQCRQALRSLARLDPVLARNAAAGGVTVDAYRDYVMRGLQRQGPDITNEQDLHLIFASRCLEQIADDAGHLAQNVVVFLGEEGPEEGHPLAS